MELKQLHDAVWALCGPVNMGLVMGDSGFIAIDTGLDKQAGKALEKAAGELGGALSAIVNTHAHADHFGGNAYLLSKRTVPVYAPVGEAAVIRRPAFEPEYLWQGAQPLPGLQNKFLLAAPSPVSVEFAPGDVLQVDGVDLTTIDLPGHAHGQAGIQVHDVLFAADAYFNEAVVDKHGIPYLVDLPQTRASAERVLEMSAAWTLPGHGQPTRDATAAVRHLIARHEAGYQCVLEAAERPITLDGLTMALCRHFSLAPANAGAWVLLHTPVAAYASAAVAAGDLDVEVRDGGLSFARHTGR